MKTLQYFDKIVRFYHAQGRMPSYREIMRLAGHKSLNQTQKVVAKLVELGRLQRDSTGRLLPTRYFHEIPWLGTVVAGWPSPADEELLDTVTLDEYLITNKEKTYMLRVQGDSMIDACILPGDLVLVEWRKEAKSGEIVIAQVDGEWTMKTYRKRGRKVTLEAANKNYDTIVPKDELKIVAVVTAVIRKY
ncbi:MAG: LexA repressor [Nitrospirales bacterium]|nr:MAG: LexA repressor [Nitrospirales bacterium]